MPFEYLFDCEQVGCTDRYRVTSAKPRGQRFVPRVHDALRAFLTTMRRFGIPVGTILTLGSYVCRCRSSGDRLSNHAFGDAIDIAGVRWVAPAPGGAAQETLVLSHNDPGERALLRRIDACLRLVFPRVIDYHTADHHNHFHCDTGNGGAVRPTEKVALRFVQEALGVVLSRVLPITGRLDAPTVQALRDFAGTPVTPDDVMLRVQRDLFTRIASRR